PYTTPFRSREQGVFRDQVLHLHAGEQPADARRDRRARVRQCVGDRRMDVQLPRSSRHRSRAERRDVADARLLHRVCRQAADGAAPHLAAGRAHRRTDRRQRDPRGYPAEDRRVRPDPLRRAALPGCRAAHRAARDGARGGRDPVRGRACVRADRLQAARGLHERESPRFRAARRLRLERARIAGRGHGDDRARSLYRRPLRGRRRAAGAPAHARHGPDGRALGAAAADGRDRPLLRDRVPRPAGARELRRRVPRAARHVVGRAGVHGDRRDRSDRGRDLLARADPALVPRAPAPRDPRRRLRPARDGLLGRDDRRADLARSSAAARARRGSADFRGAWSSRFGGGGRRHAVTFTADHFVALLPIIVLAAAAIVVMLLVAFVPNRQLAAAATIAGLAATLVSLPIAASVAPLDVTPLLVVDGAALLYTGWLLLCTLGVVGLAAGYLAARRESPGELYILLLTAALGAAVLAASSHFASLFLGFELLSVSLFALLAYSREQKPGIEAGAKYLILSGVSSAFLLFGIALIYAELGALEFVRIAELVAADGGGFYVAAGLAFIVAGIAFKLSLVPFHLWTPDVYQGAPAPITAFLATVSKGAVFVVLLRYFLDAGAFESGPVLLALSLLAGASMLLGNVLAPLQQNVKRILAYSSIAHMGYLLVAFIAGGEVAVESASYYLAAYFASTIGAFGIVAVLSSSADQEAEELTDYRGLFWRRPWLSVVFSLML